MQYNRYITVQFFNVYVNKNSLLNFVAEKKYVTCMRARLYVCVCVWEENEWIVILHSEIISSQTQ